MLSHPDLYNESEDSQEFLGLTRNLEFRDVSFSYDNERKVLKNLSFTINKGEAIGIVGPTGSGKTTISKLLPRLYEVSQG
ncbi:multidrug ABC superfamily ATP binding cassette transporter, ABC domain protein, partial [Chlamydia psittaci 84-8471/1]